MIRNNSLSVTINNKKRYIINLLNKTCKLCKENSNKKKSDLSILKNIKKLKTFYAVVEIS